QELGCFAFLLAVAIVPPVFLDRWPIPFLVQGYLTAVVLILMNFLRTLARSGMFCIPAGCGDRAAGVSGSMADSVFGAGLFDGGRADSDELPADAGKIWDVLHSCWLWRSCRRCFWIDGRFRFWCRAI